MPRTSIRAKTNAAVVDNGSLDFSVIKGEQTTFVLTMGHFTNLANAKVFGRLIEADNSAQDGNVPTAVKTGASVQSLTILEEDGTALTNNTFPSDYSGNKCRLVIEGDTLFDSWSPQPNIGDAGRVYGFYEVSTEDDGSGATQSIQVPVRGLIIVRYGIGG